MVEDDADDLTIVDRSIAETMDAIEAALRMDAAEAVLTSEQVIAAAGHKPTDWREYHLGRVAEWSQPRYRPDGRFVGLTLLIDQGEEAIQGRWQASEERYDDLGELLAAAMADDSASFLRGVMQTNVALAGRAAAQPELLPLLPAELLGDLRWALVERSRNSAADLRDRIACGNVLGDLGDARFNRLAQPVVGVCWYEARAYLRWLTEQSGLAFRLPSEVEWEAAARGEAGRAYAYGDRFNRLRGNTVETYIRQTTPVGVFPEGDSPEGATDLSGNIGQWTSSGYGEDHDKTAYPYPYDASDGREAVDTAATNLRVVRGGSWVNYQSFARAAVRGKNFPTGRGVNVGFRVVCASPIS